MNYSDYKTTRAVVIEKPHYANLRGIKLTEPKTAFLPTAAAQL